MSDPIARFIPAFADVKVYAGADELVELEREITITANHLLTQFIPSRYYPLRNQFKTLVYQALVD